MVYTIVSPTTYQQSQMVQINGVPILLIAVADTDATRAQGLSGIKGLGQNEGLLFEFDREGYYQFWMKDMLFSIDIIWIASDGTIVTIARSVSPDSYPTAFTSDSPAKYVLEVPAGFTKLHNIEEGMLVSL